MVICELRSDALVIGGRQASSAARKMSFAANERDFMRLFRSRLSASATWRLCNTSRRK